MIATNQDNLNIYNLIKSIDYNVKTNKHLLIIINQGTELILNFSNPYLTIKTIQETKISLSKARNIALKYLLENSISSEYIMFPDDDSSFDSVFFENFQAILGSKKNYITPIFATGSKELYFGEKTEENTIITAKDHQLIGSPNQIICYNRLKNTLSFNEDLGVGAKYGSCEDFDLFIRLNILGEKFVFTNQLYNYHPRKVAAYKDVQLQTIVKRFKNYSSGFAFVIFKYKLFNLIPEYLIRTIGACVIFALKFQLKLSMAYFLQFFIRIRLLINFLINGVSKNG